PAVRVQLPAGQESVVSPAALAFVDAAVRTLDRGYVVLIDYAAEGDQPAGIVHGYRRHRVEEDVLSAPGTRDITAGGDFGAGAHPAVIRPDPCRNRRRRTYRSTSPTTKNTLPSTAIRSGIRAPVSSSGIIDTFENDAVRIFRR